MYGEYFQKPTVRFKWATPIKSIGGPANSVCRARRAWCDFQQNPPSANFFAKKFKNELLFHFLKPYHFLTLLHENCQTIQNNLSLLLDEQTNTCSFCSSVLSVPSLMTRFTAGRVALPLQRTYVQTNTCSRMIAHINQNWVVTKPLHPRTHQGQCHRRATPPAESRDGKTTKRDSRQTSTTTDKDNNTHKERTTVRQTHNNNNNNNNKEIIHNVNTLVILS